MTMPILDIRNLRVSYDANVPHCAVNGVSLQVFPGEVVALVGESGSGKTSIAQAVIGLLQGNGRVDGGAILLNGTDITRWSQKRLDAVRGAVVSLIPQDPTGSLNPVMTIGAQVREILTVHGKARGKAADRRVIELLTKVGLSQPEVRARQYPHELSGGMKQRVLIAIAIALEPALIIADEPTSALDVTVQKRILDLIDDLRREFGTAVLFVTHDLGVAADRSSRLIVLKGGEIQEEGATADVLTAPQNTYTQRLLADAPSLSAPARIVRRSRAGETPLVTVENLVKDFALPDGGVQRAVDGVSFGIDPGTTHAIVGESGSGKTTTIRAIAGFERPTSGSILIDGLDARTLKGETLRQFRRKVQLVYQNPLASLDPRQSVFSIIEEPLLNFAPVARDERARRVAAILDRVGLTQATLARRPHALSGGQRQRIAIARALILEPKLVILDEAVSALDVTVQAQILSLLAELQADLGLTYLFVSHDLAVVRQIADSVSVMHEGRQVDHGSVEAVFERPTSAYTRDLIEAIPGRRRQAEGARSNPSETAEGYPA
ncbi:peptide/nickel transport system ATP-binding protein [Rhizobium sp. PP-F2F-G38]|uniref:ABC transporter ATP-binding protein n=1 Tax=Ferranicluibacter rubi TaxID=2715133 RepID=A0AA43ZFX9_9HYPH|nr:ABC transporter ATP-binding protein [Ferranicluibacter rubi]PYE34250.1 peptide/nickel transport system ATP-binding protein [Rhizobium sp. PP-WC-1G-195]PYE96886.1 peptide/nickel transport system ATP-binding protein [Rhizobium sp. PP-F2F-G38]TCP86300.1 peptide/nickel transport system ATP-binding protein [Rhizobium sp. PP-CC-2G-626]TCQ23431.1 peptide/nickel transport system ATP-binding protein [Rhizobium sp. PP-CC-3G-465]NHT77157.1 ABC transporter ATP-binding protein [Ferranicluibacter rubi]